MCRVLLYAGTCPRCNHSFTWDDLTQELFCLEAKNNGVFGQCRRSVLPEKHEHDQECDACASDEGVGGLDYDAWAGEEQVAKETKDMTHGGSSYGGSVQGGDSSRREGEQREEEDDGRKKKKRKI